MASSEWGMANGEWKNTRHPPSTLQFLPPLFATRHSLFATIQHAAANQRFHMPDVLAADLVGDRADAGGARHRVAAEKQMVAGTDQAGVEQHRVDLAELAGPNAFGEQPAMKIQQGCDKEF